MTINGAYERNPDFIYRRIVDEIVLVPIYKDVASLNAIFTLNEVGAFIWEHLAEPLTQDSLQMLILDEFDVDPLALKADLEGFLGQMKQVGAIHEV